MHKTILGLICLLSLNLWGGDDARRLYEAGQYNDALQIYDQILAKHPDWEEAHFRKGAALYKAGQIEEAMREFEQAIISHLQASPRLRKKLITQVDSDEVEKITEAKLFGFSHRPDASIGNDGTAIEIKVIKGGSAARDILGQGMAYRMQYRFVILVLVDATEDCRVVANCQDKRSPEHALFTELAESMNVFAVVGPVGKSKNVLFLPRADKSRTRTASKRRARLADDRDLKAA